MLIIKTTLTTTKSFAQNVTEKRKHFSHTKVIMQKNIRRTVAEENDLQ